MRVHAILTAAGSGLRFNTAKHQQAHIPKQFLKLHGQPIILYSLLTLQKNRSVDEIIISSKNQYFNFLHSIAVQNNISKLTKLVEGGKTRFLSVRNAFMQIEALPSDLVLIHDSARPAIDLKMLEEIIAQARRHGEVIYGTSVSETVKREKNNIITETVKREHLWTVQTPQVFRYKVLADSYKTAGKKIDYTDEAALIENAGFRVRIVEGSRKNIKLTTLEDLQILKLFLK
jgi:2-C-methyl-D-erythritol 4-phosphate cytidylyltransferase